MGLRSKKVTNSLCIKIHIPVAKCWIYTVKQKSRKSYEILKSLELSQYIGTDIIFDAEDCSYVQLQK